MNAQIPANTRVRVERQNGPDEGAAEGQIGTLRGYTAKGYARVKIDAFSRVWLIHPENLVPCLRSLECCCCGGNAGRFKQHWNRDTGYGVCAKCIAWMRSHNTTEAEILDLYGVEGVNFEALQ